MKETKEEILNDQLGGTLMVDKHSTLKEVHKVDGTPFTIVKHEEEYFITLGKYKISNNQPSWEDCMDIIERKDYEFLMNMMFCALEIFSENVKEIEKLKNNNNNER